jgi:hypothetical protein
MLRKSTACEVRRAPTVWFGQWLQPMGQEATGQASEAVVIRNRSPQQLSALYTATVARHEQLGIRITSWQGAPDGYLGGQGLARRNRQHLHCSPLCLHHTAVQSAPEMLHSGPCVHRLRHQIQASTALHTCAVSTPSRRFAFCATKSTTSWTSSSELRMSTCQTSASMQGMRLL